MELTGGRRLFLWTLVGSLCVTAAVAIGTLVFAEFDDTAARILLTTTFLAVASLLALPAGVLLDQGRAMTLAWATIAASASGLVVTLVAVWAADDEGLVWKLALTLGLAAAAGAQACASTARRRPEDGARLVWLYRVAILLSVAVAVLVAVAAWRESDDAGYYRALGALAVAAVLASLLQPIVRRLQGPPERRHELVLELDREPSEQAVAAAVETLAQHGIRAERR